MTAGRTAGWLGAAAVAAPLLGLGLVGEGAVGAAAALVSMFAPRLGAVGVTGLLTGLTGLLVAWTAVGVAEPGWAALALLAAVAPAWDGGSASRGRAAGAHGIAPLAGGAVLLAIAGETSSPAFLAPFTAWAVAFPLSWAAGDRLRARLTPVLAALGVAAVVFLAIPRWPRAASAPPMTAVDATVALPAFEAARDDPTVVARVVGAPDPVRLRSRVLAAFDGRRWGGVLPVRATPALAEDDDAVEVTVSHGDMGGAVLVPGRVVSWDLDALQDVAGAWQTAAETVSWTGRVSLEPDRTPPEPELWTALPPLDPRVRALAREVVGTRAGVDAVHALVGHLSTSTTYARGVAHPGDDPLAHFLFEDPRGHCEYLATATVVLARAAGLPARMVTGFLAREVDGASRVARQLDAHAWAEVWVEGEGWLVADPSPPPAAPRSAASLPWRSRLVGVWRRFVVEFDRALQLAAAGAAWPVLLAMGLALVGLRWRARGRRSPVASDPVSEAHAAAWEAVARAGLAPAAAAPPLTRARQVRGVAPEVGVALEALAWHLYAVRYGDASPTDHAHAARARLDDVRAALTARARAVRLDAAG